MNPRSIPLPHSSTSEAGFMVEQHRLLLTSSISPFGKHSTALLTPSRSAAPCPMVAALQDPSPKEIPGGEQR